MNRMTVENLGLETIAPVEPVFLPMLADVTMQAGVDQAPTMEPDEANTNRLTALRLKLMQHAPFLSRYLEAAAPAACCGTCPNCIGTAVAGLALPFIKRKRRE